MSMLKIFDDEEAAEDPKMSEQDKEKAKRRSVAYKRRVVHLVSNVLWVIGTAVLGIAMWRIWVPESDWTVAVRWFLTMGVSYNFIWSLKDLMGDIVFLNEEDHRGY